MMSSIRNNRGEILSTPSNGWATFALMFVLLFGHGCGSAPPTQYYTLTSSPRAAAFIDGGGPTDSHRDGDHRGSGIALGVETFRVEPPYDRHEMVYRLGEGNPEVGFYAYHRWAAPLGHLVTTGLAEGLRGAEGLSRVEPASALGQYDALLRGRVVRAEELDLPGRQEAHLELDVQLMVGGEVRWQLRVHGTASGQVKSVAAMMGLMQEAFQDAVEQVHGGLVEGLKTVDPKPFAEPMI